MGRNIPTLAGTRTGPALVRVSGARHWLTTSLCAKAEGRPSSLAGWAKDVTVAADERVASLLVVAEHLR
jgi:hypothetical protein